uniref:Uncharacterized protein n=1 Tax=Cannabis sativa TaxID=3483 RepID=A0A803NKU4_CANSA
MSASVLKDIVNVMGEKGWVPGMVAGDNSMAEQIEKMVGPIWEIGTSDGEKVKDFPTINHSKFGKFAFNGNKEGREAVVVLGVVHADDNNKYLGLPSTVSHNKNMIFGYIMDRVKRRIQSWYGKLLSRSGKEVLLKVVIQALAAYAMNVFQLPKKVCKNIEMTMCNFWWHSNSSQKKGIHRMSWKNMSKHKDIGEMGFRDIHDFNLALLGKQGWCLLTKEDSLVGRVLKAQYYPQGSNLLVELGSNPSYIWRSVLASRDLVKHGIRIRCYAVLESSLHPLVTCPVAKACWQKCVIATGTVIQASSTAWFQDGLTRWSNATIIEVAMVNVDGTIFQKANKVGFGMVARDSTGVVVEVM